MDLMGIHRIASFVHLPVDFEVPGDGYAHDHEQPVGDVDFQRNSVALVLSREQVLDYGLDDPTPDEADQRARESARLEALAAEQTEARTRFLDTLIHVVGPEGRAVLRLHEFVDHDCAECSDVDACCGGMAPWPCRTVEAVAAAAGVPVPDDI